MTRPAGSPEPLTRFATTLRRAALLCCVLAPQAFAANILFVGNSFTFAAGTPIMQYRANTVTDLNQNGTGGVPALFKSFTAQAGLHYDVFLETNPGVGIDWHLDHALGKIGQRRWDTVVLQSYSTLDAAHPGDPATLVRSVKRMAQVLKDKNASVDIRLMATWSRADQTYLPTGHWYGKPIVAMANDVRAGYDQAAAGAGLVNRVIPVGEAWNRAIQSGVADANPFDGIDPGKVNLWGTDNYHASVYGYYLEALTIFGSITGRDPRAMGPQECAAADLGISPESAVALQHIAHEQLSASGVALASSTPAAKHVACATLR
ncbi:hypothetical protein GCM10027321_05220 [Massilia terrae]|uniref:PEP-CTERM sorting domain-containing protein n=1 Tax=Massilia terrae TaxID=1811224 RepID=A0ABT2CT06_9BURK|nr:DUF4886 domain-containing protein [Massilia terrae]MCS0657118.1 PEP-CTERM sorting domain-containing protein [Massilia terrae]